MNRKERRRLDALTPDPVIHADCEHEFVRNNNDEFARCMKCNDPYTLAHQWYGYVWRMEE